MERLNQDKLLEALDNWWKEELNLKGGQIRSLFFKGRIAKGKEVLAEHKLRDQAYKQLKELIQCEDMVQQYRDEMEADQAEVELVLTTIILELLEQIERGKHASIG